MDPENRYDASNPDRMEGLYWVVGTRTMELVEFKDRFHTPGLLAQVLGAP